MYFRIKKASNNKEFFFVAYGNNHEVILVSEMYTSKQSAKHTIEVIKTQSSSAPVYDDTLE